MTASLPAFTDYEPFRAWRADPAQWLPIALDIARSHGLACTTSHVFATGTNLVIALDEKLILKIFPPFLRSQFVSERGALAQLRGRLRIAIPEIVVEGERDGWPYLVITRLSGVLGAEAWPSLPEADKERVLAEIGETIAEVQRVPAGALARIEPDWDTFMRRQIAGCRARHERLGLPQKFLDGLDELLRDAATLTALDRPPVILIGEYIPENFLLSRERLGLASRRAVRFRRRDDGEGRIRPARPERVHDRRHAAAGAQPVRGLWLFSRRYQLRSEAAADGADAAASCQRSRQAYLHRGLAAEGR